MDKITSEPKPRFRKGDAFVEIATYPLVFMEINEVEKSTENMDFCIVTWYMLNENGLNAQRRFPMGARNGKFSDFEPISRKLLKEVKSMMRQYDADVKQLTGKREAKSLYNEYNRKLIELLPDAADRLAIAEQEEKKIVTNKWFNCTEDDYWVEDNPELNDKYITLVCGVSDSYDDKEDKTITEQFFYLHDNCPYGWGTLVKSGAKYMVIEKPKK
jgi:hypothetical protein